MTEEEARKKWCPMARVFSGTNQWVCACNRNMLDRDSKKANCIASDCMMWRWHPKFVPPGKTVNLDDIKQTLGYCGKGGRE